jgi:hypothetical protein
MEGDKVVLLLHESQGPMPKKAKAGSLARPRQVQLQLTIPPAYGLQELLGILTSFPRKGSARIFMTPEMNAARGLTTAAARRPRCPKAAFPRCAGGNWEEGRKNQKPNLRHLAQRHGDTEIDHLSE